MIYFVQRVVGLIPILFLSWTLIFVVLHISHGQTCVGALCYLPCPGCDR